jgi:hypothetical protein
MQTTTFQVNIYNHQHFHLSTIFFYYAQSSSR